MKLKKIRKSTFFAIFVMFILINVNYSLSRNKLSIKEKYDIARKKFQKNPNEENTIWYGRRTAYLGDYEKAIEIFSKGLEKFPESYKLYRHRSHRYISIRKIDNAIVDSNKAIELIRGQILEVEPDGAPNPDNIPVSNTHFNIYYHLGLAYYLAGRYDEAEVTYRESLKNWSPNNDCIIANTHWLYMTLRRNNKKVKAEKILEKITSDMRNHESKDYLNCLMMYKGDSTPEELLKTQSGKGANGIMAIAAIYGVGNWYYYNGDKNKAKKLFELIIKEKAKAAFGYIAAENDLKNMK